MAHEFVGDLQPQPGRGDTSVLEREARLPVTLSSLAVIVAVLSQMSFLKKSADKVPPGPPSGGPAEVLEGPGPTSPVTSGVLQHRGEFQLN